jgi:hypothetical protein
MYHPLEVAHESTHYCRRHGAYASSAQGFRLVARASETRSAANSLLFWLCILIVRLAEAFVRFLAAGGAIAESNSGVTVTAANSSDTFALVQPSRTPLKENTLHSRRRNGLDDKVLVGRT